MATIAARALALAVLASSLTATVPAHAADAPTIVEITTENNGGGLSPYVHLHSSIAVTFTDPTPSAATDYRVVTPGVDLGDVGVQETGNGDAFVAVFPVYSLTHGETYEFTVREKSGGETVSASAAQPFTFEYVKHPRRLRTSSTKVDGQWSYPAGAVARLDFVGSWEPGTRFSTQVWVSRRKRFTSNDWTRNLEGAALVDHEGLRDEPVLKFRVPRRLVGKYVWVSVLGWKDGEAGWLFTVPAERVIRR